MLSSVYIIIIVILIAACIYLYPLHKVNLQEVKEAESRVTAAATQLQSLNQELAIGINKQKALLDNIENYSNIEKQMANNMDNAAELMRIKYLEAEKNAQESYFSMLEENVQKYNESLSSLQEVEQELASQKASAQAYIELLKKENELPEDDKSFSLTADEIWDVERLMSVSKDLRIGTNILNKTIWEAYYKTKLTVLLDKIAPTSSKIVCIYKITEKETGKVYIGQTKDFRKRIISHVRGGLGMGNSDTPLYKRMQTVGPQYFTYEILEMCSVEELNNKEKYWIDFYNSTDYGFNATIGGAASKGNNE